MIFFCCAIREVPLNNLSSTPISSSAQQSRERKNLSKKMWKFKEKSERKCTRNSIKFDPIITSHDERNLKLYCRLQTRIWANDNGSAIMQISGSHICQRLHNFPEKKTPISIVKHDGKLWSWEKLLHAALKVSFYELFKLAGFCNFARAKNVNDAATCTSKEQVSRKKWIVQMGFIN